jgi:hypothetical protein
MYRKYICATIELVLWCYILLTEWIMYVCIILLLLTCRHKCVLYIIIHSRLGMCVCVLCCVVCVCVCVCVCSRMSMCVYVGMCARAGVWDCLLTLNLIVAPARPPSAISIHSWHKRPAQAWSQKRTCKWMGKTTVSVDECRLKEWHPVRNRFDLTLRNMLYGL